MCNYPMGKLTYRKGVNFFLQNFPQFICMQILCSVKCAGFFF